MKTLTLLRHAKSSWDDGATRDFDRPLNRRGRRAAQTVGRHLQAVGLSFDLVFASPAIRVLETLGEIETGYGQALGARFDRRLYLAPAELLLEIVHAADAAAESLLLVGHNPGLETLALRLGAPSPLRAEIAIKYPTATLAQMTFPVERWADVERGTGALTRLVRPRDLDPELGPDEDS